MPSAQLAYVKSIDIPTNKCVLIVFPGLENGASGVESMCQEVADLSDKSSIDVKNIKKGTWINVQLNTRGKVALISESSTAQKIVKLNFEVKSADRVPNSEVHYIALSKIWPECFGRLLFESTDVPEGVSTWEGKFKMGTNDLPTMSNSFITSNNIKWVSTGRAKMTSHTPPKKASAARDPNQKYSEEELTKLADNIVDLMKRNDIKQHLHKENQELFNRLVKLAQEYTNERNLDSSI